MDNIELTVSVPEISMITPPVSVTALTFPKPAMSSVKFPLSLPATPMTQLLNTGAAMPMLNTPVSVPIPVPMLKPAVSVPVMPGVKLPVSVPVIKSKQLNTGCLISMPKTPSLAPVLAGLLPKHPVSVPMKPNVTVPLSIPAIQGKQLPPTVINTPVVRSADEMKKLPFSGPGIPHRMFPVLGNMKKQCK